jgi:ankyrin repeat protein
MEAPQGTIDIHDAVKKNDQRLITRYIFSGGNLNLLDQDGKSPLQRALDAQHFELARSLLMNGAYLEKVPADIDSLYPNSTYCRLVTCILNESDLYVANELMRKHKLHEFAINLSISQARVKAVTEFLNTKDFSLKELSKFLTLTHLLKDTSTVAEHRARYKTIRDLLASFTTARVIQSNK